MGADGLLHELGDGAVVDAAVYRAFITPRRGRYDVFAWVLAWFYDEW